jgi:hypothetical protein
VSRVVLLNLEQATVTIRCMSEKVSVSAIETLASGGVRLVCSSSVGAATIRRKLKEYLIEGEVRRERHRPIKPLW